MLTPGGEPDQGGWRMDKSHSGVAAIVGGGTMGADVAMIYAAGGWMTHVVETSESTRAKLPEYFAKGLAAMGSDRLGRIALHAALESAPWRDIEMVVECV